MKPYYLRILSLILLAGLLSCSRCQEKTSLDAGPAQESVAKLIKPQGPVHWKTASTTEWKPVVDGQPVSLGDSVRTGQGGKVLIEFKDGSQITLDENSELNLSELEDEFALLMEQGNLEITAKGSGKGGFRILFGEAKDFILLRMGQAKLSMQEDGVHIEMIVGQATILQAGSSTTLMAGNKFVMRIGEATLTRESLATTLQDKRRSSLIRLPGSKRFQRPSDSNFVLDLGTDIKTSAKNPIELVDPAGGQMTVGVKSQAQYNGAFRSSRGREGSIKLDEGSTRVRLRSESMDSASQEITTPHATILARAPGLTANAEVDCDKNGTQLAIQTGLAEVTVGDKKIQVKAGQTLSVQKGGKILGPENLPSPKLQVRESKRTTIFFDRMVSKIDLSWKKKDPKETFILEISRTPAFKTFVLREPLEGNNFVFDIERSGAYYWRVVRKSTSEAQDLTGPSALIEFKHDPTAKRIESSNLTNIVRDTGIRTKVMFQGKAPGLTFKWDKVDGAVSYRLRLYPEDDMETPLLDENISTNRYVLPSGKLKEGTYYWYQVSRDAQEQEIQTSQMNKLELVFDNAAPLLRIDSPRPGERPKKRQIEVRGLAAAGSTLTVNGQSIEISEDGRFKQTLSNLAPGTILIFQLRKSGSGQIFFTRHLGK